MILTGDNRSNRVKTCPSAALSATNPTWTEPESNPGLRGGRPATNRLSWHGLVLVLRCSTKIKYTLIFSYSKTIQCHYFKWPQSPVTSRRFANATYQAPTPVYFLSAYGRLWCPCELSVVVITISVGYIRQSCIFRRKFYDAQALHRGYRQCEDKQNISGMLGNTGWSLC